MKIFLGILGIKSHEGNISVFRSKCAVMNFS